MQYYSSIIYPSYNYINAGGHGAATGKGAGASNNKVGHYQNYQQSHVNIFNFIFP